MDRKGLSREVLLDRWLDAREVRNIVGKMTSLYAVRQEASIFAQFWSGRDDVCLGVNEGFFVGRDAVAEYYAGLDRRIRLESELMRRALPKQLGGKTEEELYGVGSMVYKPFDTQVVEVARDGKTAKGLWCMRGTHSRVTTAGPVAYWQWGYLAVDFIREGEQFRIWHMQDLTDIDSPCGQNWGLPPEKLPEQAVFAPIAALHDPEPNVKRCLRRLYTPERDFSPPPELPRPYETFAETFSYGYEEDAT